MSRYLTTVHLSRNGRELAEQYESNEAAAAKNDPLQTRLKVYLLHRASEDENLVRWAKGFLCSLVGADCIEWCDAGVFDLFSIDDAKKMKETMASCKKVILLATPECGKSALISWQVGLADQMKGANNVAILPLLSHADNWERRDYYSFYNRIEKPEKDWKVLSPGYDYTGVPLLEWLEQ